MRKSALDLQSILWIMLVACFDVSEKSLDQIREERAKNEQEKKEAEIARKQSQKQGNI